MAATPDPASSLDPHGGSQKPTPLGLRPIANLIEHVVGQPIGRVVFSQGVPQLSREEGLVELPEDVATLARGAEKHFPGTPA